MIKIIFILLILSCSSLFAEKEKSRFNKNDYEFILQRSSSYKKMLLKINCKKDQKYCSIEQSIGDTRFKKVKAREYFFVMDLVKLNKLLKNHKLNKKCKTSISEITLIVNNEKLTANCINKNKKLLENVTGIEGNANRELFL
jgi:hypothetical protein